MKIKNRNYKVKPLTINRRKVALEFIGQFCKEKKYCPNMREIGEATFISSTSVVAYYMTMLKGEGLIDFVPKQARTIHLTEEGELYIATRVSVGAAVKINAK